jgi:hypothetical protein
MTSTTDGAAERPPFSFFPKETFMTKIAARRDKYFLRDLHQEIDLYDRKLAYNKLAEFTSAAERQEAEKSLLAKRAPLEKAALALAASGVEYEEKDLPRSFRTAGHEQNDAQKTLTLVRRP